MKSDIYLTHHIKPQKQRETYVLFAVTLFFRKIKSFFCFLFCFILVHVGVREARKGNNAGFN